MKSKKIETVLTMQAPRTRTRAKNLSVTMTGSQIALQGELKRLETEHKRSFDAAKQSRLLSDWVINPTHINDDIVNALLTLRSRSRDLYQNNAHVQNYYQQLETHIVGPTGFTFHARTMKKVGKDLKPNSIVNDLADVHFKRFCEKGVCDITGKHSMQSLLGLIVTTMARDGEAIVLKRRVKVSKKNPYGFALQMIASERLDTSYSTGINAAGGYICMGIEVDANMVPVAYYFNDSLASPAMQRTQAIRKRVVADDVLHIFAQEHAEQIRGVPWLNAVMKSLHQLQQFEDYTMVAARIGAAKTGFFYRDDDRAVGAEALATGMDENGELVIDAEPGMFQALPPGWKFQAFTPDFPAATFEAFVKAVKRSIANGLRIGYNTLFQDLSDVNYSSIRQDLIASRDMWRNLHSFIIEAFMEPVYEAWLVEAFKNNALTDDYGYQIPDTAITGLMRDYTFHGRAFPQIDPKNDIEALKIMSDLGIISRTRIAEMMGEDIYAQGEESATYRDFVKSLDLPVVGLNDPEINAERQDAKDAAAAQADAVKAQAASTQAQADAAKVTAATKAFVDATDASVKVLQDEVASVQTMLREALERSFVKPLQIMNAEEIDALTAIILEDDADKKIDSLACDVAALPPSEYIETAAPDLAQELDDVTTAIQADIATDEVFNDALESSQETQLEQVAQQLVEVISEIEASLLAAKKLENGDV